MTDDVDVHLLAAAPYMVLRNAEHPTGPAGRVVDRADCAFLQHLVVLVNDEIHHQFDDLTGGSPAVSLLGSLNFRFS